MPGEHDDGGGCPWSVGHGIPVGAAHEGDIAGVQRDLVAGADAQPRAAGGDDDDSQRRLVPDLDRPGCGEEGPQGEGAPRPRSVKEGAELVHPPTVCRRGRSRKSLAYVFKTMTHGSSRRGRVE